MATLMIQKFSKPKLKITRWSMKSSAKCMQCSFGIPMPNGNRSQKRGISETVGLLRDSRGVVLAMNKFGIMKPRAVAATWISTRLTFLRPFTKASHEQQSDGGATSLESTEPKRPGRRRHQKEESEHHLLRRWPGWSPSGENARNPVRRSTRPRRRVISSFSCAEKFIEMSLTEQKASSRKTCRSRRGKTVLTVRLKK